MQDLQIGQILVDRGVMRVDQVACVLKRQQQLRGSPFGRLAESMFGVSVGEVAAALAQQFASSTPWVNLAHQPLDPRVLPLVSPREAWDALVLPMRREDRELVCATAQETLTDAIALIQRRVAEPFRLVFAELRPLEQFIAERYDYEGCEVEEAA